MISSPTKPSPDAERRHAPERRREPKRRVAERRLVLVPTPVEHRSGGDQRRTSDRRSGTERRGLWGQETVEEHIRNATQLLVVIAESGSLDEELRRDLDAAMLRLRFAVDQLRRGG